MTIVIWAIIYLILGILFAESILKIMKREDPIRYLEVKELHKIIYALLTCIWAPLIVFAIIKLLLKGIFK